MSNIDGFENSPIIRRKRNVRVLSDYDDDTSILPRTPPIFSSPKLVYIEPKVIILTPKNGLSPPTPKFQRYSPQVSVESLLRISTPKNLASPMSPRRKENVAINITPLRSTICSNGSSSTLGRNIIDTRIEKVSLWFESQQSLTRFARNESEDEDLSPILNSRKSIGKQRVDQKSLSLNQIQSDYNYRTTVDMQQNLDSSIIEIKSDNDEARSVELSSMIVSSLQSETVISLSPNLGEELTPLEVERTDLPTFDSEEEPRFLESEITNAETPSPTYASSTSENITNSYITNTTSLWDLPIDWNYNCRTPTPSDSTGDEDYDVVYERRYQKEIHRKEQEKHRIENERIEKKKLREKYFKKFYIDNITWSQFSCDHIRFSLKPKDLFPEYFSSKKKYTLSMKYNGRHWNIKTFRLPDWERILKEKSKRPITDKNLENFLKTVVKILMRNIKHQIEYRVERKQEFYNGEDLDLNDSEIELFLDEEERQEYLENRERVCRRMMSPQTN